ncbi:MAG: oligopeptide transporter, superfamily [Bacteriovoracaceae bacterium]|nr:oligopeptide transporter, superfamily [Bacteriovoracaceae bacterium]
MSANNQKSHNDEFTVRAVIAGAVIAAVMGASYPYIVLKLGFGPNVSVVAAFFGFLALGFIFKDFNQRENNIIQTAGTSASSTAFMCVLLAAFDFLQATPGLNFHFVITPFQAFVWLTTGGLLGVLLAVPLRRLFIIEQKLPYADGIAAAETIIALDARSPEAKRTSKVLGIGALASGAVMVAQSKFLEWIPEVLSFGARGATMAVGVAWSLLSVGSGMLVGLRICISMLIGTIVAWVIAPEVLSHYGIILEFKRIAVLRWVMWPATGILISAGLTAVALQWRSLVDTFRSFSFKRLDSSEFPIAWVVIGSLITGVALIIVQSTIFGTPAWMTVIAILCSIPLMIAGLRVLGETNWGPISALSNMMQGVFGFIAPGHIMGNMISSGTTGIIATESEGLIQDYKTGDMLGSSPKYMTYAQLMGVPIGAAAVSYMYPVLKNAYGIGGDNGLSSPISQKWASFAELLSKGASALPHGAITALIVGAVLGLVLTLLEKTRWKNWVPSGTGIGIGMLVPGMYIVTMFLGGVLAWIWTAKKPKQAGAYLAPLASGLIAGEAIIAVILSLLIFAGVLA